MNDSSGQHLTRPRGNDADDRLDSWKEIAVYLERTVTTLERWEKEEGLPVHRHVHHKKASVYAYCSEIDTWRKNRSSALGNNRPGWFRFFSENKKTVAGGVTLLLLVGLVTWMYIGSSPNPEGLSFHQRDWVLIADFENRTGEAVFDGVLESALRREIANSQFVNVVPRERINDTLQLMRKPLDIPIDSEVGREISLRDGGIRALLTGRVEKVDSTYLLSIELIDPTQGQLIGATSEEAAGEGQVLSALVSLSNWTRENLGERLELVEESAAKLEKVTTPSLRALQLFTKGEALISQSSQQTLAEELLKQALEIDPEFASAHIYLAWAVHNQRRPAEEYLPFAEKAFQLAETTGERERYFIHGSYYQLKGEQERAAHAYKTLLSLYPDHFWALGGLNLYFRSVGDEKRALPYLLRHVELRPNNFEANLSIASNLIHIDSNLLRARKYFDRVRNLLTDDLIRVGGSSIVKVMLFSAQEAWLRGDPETALAEIGQVSQKLESLGLSGNTMLPVATLYYSLGKVQLAHRLFTDSLDRKSPSRGLHQLAFYYEATKPHLRQYLGISEGSISHPAIAGGTAHTAIVLARAGFTVESEAIITEYERDPSKRPNARTTFQMARGVLSLSKGNTTEGMRLIEDALGQARGRHFLGSLILAEAWREQGRLVLALRVLEEASSKKALLFAPYAGENPARSLRIRLMLAKTYREMGRDEDAREIEAELRSLLALADADHPILRQLDRTKELALREAAN